MDPYAQMKQGTRWMWSLGDYGELAPMLEPAADALVAACDPDPGPDAAAGTGNVAVLAARRGATVIASDLMPRMVQLGRARSEAEHLGVVWMEADAEALPFATGRFDVVTSAFGVMFAPRPEIAASELFRVTRPGGLVVMANYTDDGFFGRLGSIVASNARSERCRTGNRPSSLAQMAARSG
jgi:SAM-dependent methyltransferase